MADQIYLLVAVDITGVGGPMGSVSTPVTMRRYFRSKEGAKAAAEKHYNGSRGPIKWERSSGYITSGDLGYVMYTISPLKVEG